ncbi:hypothetical protein CASFOL_016028 [Castilleja foliolosa]|uniref:Uncharacterized protein n=1 Tax=Castilleja foliolosa TaxID=1961234 RepID=A0ABD3DFE4_9LAMI
MLAKIWHSQRRRPQPAVSKTLEEAKSLSKKRKHSFIQFAAMTGILLLSCRSLGQKYRIHDLTEDTAALREDQEILYIRMDHIRRSLLAEAALEPTGIFAARLRFLFGDESN